MTDRQQDQPKLSKKRRLSDTFLDKHGPAPPGKRIIIWDTTPGFGCRITDKGTISFFVMRRRTGAHGAKPIRIVLGPYGPQWCVQRARARAKEYLDQLSTGVDPRLPKQQEADEQDRANVFHAVADLYHTRHLQHVGNGLNTWRYIDRELLWPRKGQASWRNKLITKVTADDVQERIEALRDSGKKEAARRLFEAIRGLFKWAKKLRSYKLRDLPSDEIDPNAILGKKIKHKYILSNEYLRALWRAAKKLGYPDGTYVQLLLLTALRRREAARATWNEFTVAGKDDDAWIIPARRMKTASPHVVPVTPDIAALLRGIPRFQGKFVFSFTGGHNPINNFTSVREKLDRLILKELRALAKARSDDPAKVVPRPLYTD